MLETTAGTEEEQNENSREMVNTQKQQKKALTKCFEPFHLAPISLHIHIEAEHHHDQDDCGDEPSLLHQEWIANGEA